ncbi:MAG: UDP-glucose 4-epimerase GalE [Melioribacteraceae bacterium]|nr:UDP-glucose 4-epimerase GalE [Melioribacteraceae bacterium]MCF8264534.1 UDP-glucose 4-epimerase GalE [Melioribacteraceae bacterium]
MKTLVTGGAGYIGSHFVKKLASSGKEVLVLDNLSRGHKESIHPKTSFVNVDLTDRDKLFDIIQKEEIDAVVHFAAFAYVGESVENPSMYYHNNVIGSINLIDAVVQNKIENFVFSSTCSLYGNPERVPISENEPVNPINPYAKTKRIIEFLLEDYSQSHSLNYCALRYFNAAGADPDGEIGESHDPEPHLIPLALFTAMQKREKLLVFGDDYETKDGTCVRDYIHINDLADAHILALEYLKINKESNVINLGTGEGNSVFEIIKTVEELTGKSVPFDVVGRRAGDPAVLVADNKKAKSILGWSPKHDLRSIIQTAWNWHNNQKY